MSFFFSQSSESVPALCVDQNIFGIWKQGMNATNQLSSDFVEIFPTFWQGYSLNWNESTVEEHARRRQYNMGA
jgi:hypothetical protein